MKNFIKGAILASSLLGMYSVAEHIQQPSAYVAEASLLDSLKTEAKKKNCAYSDLDWVYQPEGKCTFVKTSDGIMDVYGHHPNAKGKVIDTGAVFEAEDGKKGYISKNDLPKKCQEYFGEYADNATFYIKCSNNKIYEYRNFNWTNVGLWYLDDDNDEWSYYADDGKFTRSSLSSSNSSSGSSSNTIPSNSSSGLYIPYKYVYITNNIKFKEDKSYVMKEWKKEGDTKYGRIYYRDNYKGTVIFRNIHEITLEKQTKKKYVIKNKNANIYKDKYFDKKVDSGSKYLNKHFISTLKYNVGNNSYYSIYDNNNKWVGYIHSNNLRNVNSVKSISKDIVMTHDQTTYKDIGLTTKKSSVKKGQVFKAKRIYDIGSKKPYYSLYGIDSKGKEYWKGYTYGNLQDVKKQNVSKEVIVKKKDYTLWKNFYFNQKKGNTNKYIGKKLTCKVVYTLNDNRKYYSLYSGKTWLGYVNSSAVTTIQSSKKINQTMTIIDDKVLLWNDLILKNKKGYATRGQVYQSKYEYTLDNGQKYYSMYTQDSKEQLVWCGYLEESGAVKLSDEIVNVKAIINNNYDDYRWNNLYFINKLGKVDDYKEKVLNIQNIYTLGNGQKYCKSFYNGEFIGYINKNHFKFIKDIKSVDNLYAQITNNSIIFNDLLLKNKKTDHSSIDNTYKVKKIYNFQDDNNYIYELYNNNEFIGYIPSDSVSTFSLKEESIENEYVKLKDTEIYNDIFTENKIPIDIKKDYIIKSKILKTSINSNKTTIYYKVYDLDKKFIGYIKQDSNEDFLESESFINLKEKYDKFMKEFNEYHEYYELNSEEKEKLEYIRRNIQYKNNKVSFINNSLIFLENLKNNEIIKDWEYTETKSSITLNKYIGLSSDIVIPGELRGKNVYISQSIWRSLDSFGYYHSLNSLAFKIRNNKKVIPLNSLQRIYRVKNLNVSGLDVSKITDMSHLFRDSKLQSIVGLENWDTSNVTNMSYMFSNCNNLKNVSGLENWDTSNVTNMSYMFSGWHNLTHLNSLYYWDTSNVTNMSGMFEDCYNLQNISGLKRWNTSNVTNMSYMFYNNYISSLSSLYNWNVSSVTNMQSMFSKCDILNDVSGLKNWDISNVINMNYMFMNCYNLKDIDPLFNWHNNNKPQLYDIFDNTKVAKYDINQFMKNFNQS